MQCYKSVNIFFLGQDPGSQLIMGQAGPGFYLDIKNVVNSFNFFAF
jgi:hypothetical protein